MLVEFARGRRVVHVGFVDEHRLEGEGRAGDVAPCQAGRIGVVTDRPRPRGRRRAVGRRARLRGLRRRRTVGRGRRGARAGACRRGHCRRGGRAPGRSRPFFASLRQLVREDGLLVVTTPNAFRLLNFLAPVGGVELVHPDHTAWHNPHPDDAARAWLGGRGHRLLPEPGSSAGGRHRDVRPLRPVCVRPHRPSAPYWSDGFVVWAHPAPHSRLRLSGARGRSSVG